VHASADRIMKITVCTRPFRAQGPRIEAEPIGAKTIVHNYGHGGSGWSLSWGSSTLAVQLALATGQRRIGVLGAGALGLTSALLAQRAGAQVTLYAKELPPDTRSSLATGSFTPDSRICLTSAITPEFKQRWEQMARTSFKAYTNLLGLPGNPVEFVDTYFLSDQPPGRSAPTLAAPAISPVDFARLAGDLIPDLFTAPEDLAPGEHPFAPPYARRSHDLMFNLVAYQRLLLTEFRINGGQVEITELHSAADFARLKETTIINATGYGARALLNDNSVVPVRGQLARLIPQPEVRYAFEYQSVYFLPRRDGLVVQEIGADEAKGYNDDTTVPDRAEAERALAVIARAVAGMSERGAA
jgi:glycine/D-amino acid oxidase-like deaminating enzyme